MGALVTEATRAVSLVADSTRRIDAQLRAVAKDVVVAVARRATGLGYARLVLGVAALRVRAGVFGQAVTAAVATQLAAVAPTVVVVGHTVRRRDTRHIRGL